jgi:hypothetical protein
MDERQSADDQADMSVAAWCDSGCLAVLWIPAAVFQRHMTNFSRRSSIRVAIL